MQRSATEEMRLFDTHVHFPVGPEEKQALVERALAAGVDRMIAVGGSPEANQSAVEIARKYPAHVRAAVGINRDQAEADWPADELTALLAAPEIAAIGEIGLDFHREQQTRNAQLELFERMLAIAGERGLPVIVHSRAAEAETMALLEQHVRKWTDSQDRIGVQHCFTGSRAYAERLLALGFFISFSGIITFKNAADLREIAASIPEDRLLIETDSPWLTPEPFRGQPNEPAHVRRVAETLAEVRHCSLAEIAAVTFRNAERLFGR